MKAVILAAGIGSRLKPITDEKPKTLTTINEKPILDYILQALIKNKINNIIICVGYKASLVINHCKLNYPSLNLIFVENLDYENTNNMYSLYLARNYLNDDILLINGDVVFDYEILKGLIKQKISCVAVDKKHYYEESMKVTINKKGFINKISKKITYEESYATSIDVYKITKKDMPLIINETKRIIEKEKIKTQWTEVMLNNLFSQQTVKAIPYDIKNKRWYEIDNFQDLNQAELLFNDKLNKLKEKKVFFFDIDGTLVIDEKITNGANELIKKIKSKNKYIYVLSNNSSKTPEDHYLRLKNVGLKIDKKNVLTSLQSTIFFLKQKNIKSIFWVANKKVSLFLKKNGFVYNEKNPQAILLTYDTEINYKKLVKFSILVRKDIPYLATHRDLAYPSNAGPIPDIGSFIELIKSTTNKIPNKIFGKPNKDFIDIIIKKYNLNYKDCVVIGDRLYTDIKLAENSEITSILVLTGETKREDYEKSDIKADIVISDLKQLIKYL